MTIFSVTIKSQAGTFFAGSFVNQLAAYDNARNDLLDLHEQGDRSAEAYVFRCNGQTGEVLSRSTVELPLCV